MTWSGFLAQVRSSLWLLMDSEILLELLLRRSMFLWSSHCLGPPVWLVRVIPLACLLSVDLLAALPVNCLTTRSGQLWLGGAFLEPVWTSSLAFLPQNLMHLSLEI